MQNIWNVNFILNTYIYFLQEAIVIILDIGHSVSQDTETIKADFLENARQCVSMILKRKVRCIVIGESLVWILTAFNLGLKR